MKYFTITKFRTILIVAVILSAVALNAQSTEHEDAAALALKSANPVANMISVPIQLNLGFGTGEYKRPSQLLNLMPVIPFNLFSWRVINRIIIPISNQPDSTENGGYYTGLGNINYSMMFVPPSKGKIQWGFGPAFNIPSRSNKYLGSDAFGVGPAIVFVLTSGNWVAGVTANNVWSFASDKNLNQLFLQYFIHYNIKKGWYLDSGPMLTANWNAPEGEQWTVPVGAGFGKVFKAGNQSMKLQGEYYYNVVAPIGAPDWTIQILFVLLFPQK